MGTIFDIAISFMKKPSPPVNKSDGFMPIRDASLATVQGEVSDSFARSDHSSDTTRVLNPSPEVTFSSTTRLESFPQRKDEPSKLGYSRSI